MTQEKAETLAICSLIDRAIREGYPNTIEGKEYMKVAREWMQDNNEKRSKKHDKQTVQGIL